MKKLVLALCSVAILTGCSKQVNDPTPAKSTSRVIPAFRTITTTFNSMPAVFQSLNVQALQVAMNNNDEATAAQLLMNLASEITLYIQDKYDANFTANIALDYKEIIVMGMGYVEFEAHPVAVTQSDEVDCIISAVGAIIGVNDVMGIVNDFRNGVSATTILGTAKLALKRVATALTVAFAIYELGDCLDWW